MLKKRPEAWPHPTRYARCGSNIRDGGHITQRSGKIEWANQFNEKAPPEKQAEGALTLAKERPEPEAIRSANQINEIDLAGQQAA